MKIHQKTRIERTISLDLKEVYTAIHDLLDKANVDNDPLKRSLLEPGLNNARMRIEKDKLIISFSAEEDNLNA